MQKLKWYFKQLFPLKYHTKYGEGGKNYVAVWRMWFGRCFAVEIYEVAG